jgi:hypothetical protein
MPPENKFAGDKPTTSSITARISSVPAFIGNNTVLKSQHSEAFLMLSGSQSKSSTAVNDAAKRIELRLRKLARFFPPCRLKIGTYLQNLSFGEQEPMFPVGPSIGTKPTRIMFERHAPDRERLTVNREPLSEPGSQSRLRDTLDDMSGLPGIVKALAGPCIDVGFRLHPRRMPIFLGGVTFFVWAMLPRPGRARA